MDWKALRSLGELKLYPLSSAAQITARCRGADILITNKCRLGEGEFAKLPDLKLIAITATGYNNIDVEAARKRGIAVANVAGYSTASVVEHAILFLLAFAHRLLEHQDAGLQRWKSSPFFAILDHPFSDLQGKTLGIIGYGTIGKRVANIARALGMRVLVAELPGRRYPNSERRVLFRSLLQASDYVSLHSALSPDTQHLLNAQSLKWMKKTAYLVNLARGPLVDEAAVAKALLAGKLAGYASDVMEQEPPPENHAFWDPKLKNKLLLTPHIAWASRESRQRLMGEVCANIEAFLRGKKRNRIC